ncbi:WAT1-related protein At1g43650-like [Camellia sinensis]|uniref:WAT1-related protein At1g43650-like n=1 Tax=Camellia sinensis TaxID=4442 RepID=UPI001036D35A|nr:WAT1-related protein At1g43650-like [Camellia sinensis]
MNMKMKSSNAILGCSHLMMLMKNNLPDICMVMCNIVYAGMVLLSKAVISKGMNPYIFGAYRQAFATIALAPFAFYLERKNSAPLSCSILCKIFLASLIGITLCINLWNISLGYIPATFVSATSNAIPAITFILAILLRRESVAITEWSGVAKVLGTMLCVGGAVVYSFVKGPPVYPQATQDQNSQSYTGCGTKAQCLKGSLFALSAQVNWSLWLIMQGPLTKIYPDKLRLTTIQCFFSCIQSAIWAVAVERNISAWKLGWDLNLLVVAYCGVIFVAPTFWLRIWVIEKRGPVFSAAFNPLGFIVTAIFSAFLWKETPHWGSVCGALLLVGGLYGVLWGKHKEAKAKPLLEQKSETKETKSVEQKSETKEESV